MIVPLQKAIKSGQVKEGKGVKGIRNREMKIICILKKIYIVVTKTDSEEI